MHFIASFRSQGAQDCGGNEGAGLQAECGGPIFAQQGIWKCWAAGRGARHPQGDGDAGHCTHQVQLHQRCLVVRRPIASLPLDLVYVVEMTHALGRSFPSLFVLNVSSQLLHPFPWCEAWLCWACLIQRQGA